MALCEADENYALDDPFNSNSSIFNKICVFGIILLLEVYSIIITYLYIALYVVGMETFVTHIHIF